MTMDVSCARGQGVKAAPAQRAAGYKGSTESGSAPKTYVSIRGRARISGVISIHFAHPRGGSRRREGCRRAREDGRERRRGTMDGWMCVGRWMRVARGGWRNGRIGRASSDDDDEIQTTKTDE